MHNTWLIIRREYLERVRAKAFIIFTFLTPALMAGMAILPAKLMSMKSNKAQRVAIVSSDPLLGATVRDKLQESSKAAAGSTSKDDGEQKYDVTLYDTPSDSLRAELSKKVTSGELNGYLWITDEALAARKVPYATKTATDFTDFATVASALRSARTKTELMKKGLNAADVEQVTKYISLEPTKLENGKESKSNTGAAIMLPFIMMLMIYMTLIIYGIAVMRSVIEEKNSRIVEVLLSSVSASELMAGKVLGVGAVGLTQMLIWGICTAVVSAAPLIGAGSYLKDLQVNPMLFVLMPVFFLLGYALYSAVYAAVGAMVNSEEEGQQLQFPIMLPLILCTAMTWGVIRQPNSPLSFWLSMIPLTSPIIMFVRASIEMPPMWQLGLSIGIQIATIYLVIQLASRIYRVGILMYGKRPTLPEIVKWVRYA
jgi:ABC-2 type transport system permease protein